jgi:hypothetical protein
MASGKQLFYHHDSRERFCSEEEKALPAAPAKRVRFRSEEVGSSSARGRRSYTHASTKGCTPATPGSQRPSLPWVCYAWS